MFFYEEPKRGKKTTPSNFDKNLLLAFEKCYNAIPGVITHSIYDWAEFRKVFRQLKNSKAKEMFSTITIDTMFEIYLQ